MQIAGRRYTPGTNGWGLTPQGRPLPPVLAALSCSLPPAPACCPGKGRQSQPGGQRLGPHRGEHGAGAVVRRGASERVSSGMPRFDLARIKTRLSATSLTKIIVQLNKKNYLITQACSLVVKLKELQAYVNIAALQQRCFIEIVVLL